MLALCLTSLLFGCGAPNHGQVPIDTTYRWFLLSTYTPRDADVVSALKSIDDAGAAGYNGVVFQDLSLASRTTITPAHLANIQKLLAEAKKMNIEVIPMTAPLGQDLLDQDPSLAESMPCRNVRFTLTNGQFKPSDPVPPIINGGLETFAGTVPTGFKGGNHGPDVAVFQDTAVHHGGASCMRIEGQPTSKNGTAGVWMEQPLKVLPWHNYRASIWSKSTNASGSGVYLNVLTTSGLQIGFPNWHDSADWVRSDTVFNSEGNTDLTLVLGVQPVPTAKIWLDDVTFDNAGLLNITRRDDCPVNIRGDDGTIYNEGADIAPLLDGFHSKGMGPGHLEVEHDAPPPGGPL